MPATLSSTSRSVGLTAALLHRATLLIDQGDPMGDDSAASMTLGSLALEVMGLTPAPIVVDLNAVDVLSQRTAHDCVVAAAGQTGNWDLAELSPEATRFLLALHDLVHR